MASTTQPYPRSHLFHRSSSRLHIHRSRSASPSTQTQSTIFEGTDTVRQKRTVAVQRVVEAHDALEIKRHTEMAASMPSLSRSTSTISSDSLRTEFSDMTLPDAEVRTFKYFLRMWDSSTAADPEFDDAIQSSRSEFEASAIKHFFQRIASWEQGEDTQNAAKRTFLSRDARRRNKRKDKDASELGRLWAVEKQEHIQKDELKEVTTREGLAQLLWTLMHDVQAPLAPGLFAETKDAVRRMYGIRS